VLAVLARHLHCHLERGPAIDLKVRHIDLIDFGCVQALCARRPAIALAAEQLFRLCKRWRREGWVIRIDFLDPYCHAVVRYGVKLVLARGGGRKVGAVVRHKVVEAGHHIAVTQVPHRHISLIPRDVVRDAELKLLDLKCVHARGPAGEVGRLGRSCAVALKFIGLRIVPVLVQVLVVPRMPAILADQPCEKALAEGSTVAVAALNWCGLGRGQL